ncbi:mitochondrial carrier protein [Pochonia chlamydosporia 170]|uniref:Mitochondrial carrier protein n=1 Tax=Pochonia chlamydosporia 170 TaxID=1380566 RepID=A0A179FMZ8_METCM|nr:mitochondrial carrier protein [Pochonia chlamydosporia 170]OAQ66668.1 mitochondrial carrier protein [Pochonia chlamydosporia 170]
MAVDFWAGYLSGAVGILVGNPLDIMKVQLQAGNTLTCGTRSQGTAALITGTAAPVLGYGALNALLFVSYNRSENAFQRALCTGTDKSLVATWLAGAVGGLATWVVSAPTELVKCRAQMSAPSESSWSIARDIWKADGLRGFYLGGVVTALRDSVGYGFYFWSYELANRYWPSSVHDDAPSLRQEAPKILLCGGLAGVVTWASVFPLDTIKTRVQTQRIAFHQETAPIIYKPNTYGLRAPNRLGSLDVARTMLAEGGLRIFFRGLTVCSIRAFIVNAVQWAVYEWVMMEFSKDYKRNVAAKDNMMVHDH